MSKNFEELDFRPTPIGDLMLRRRRMSLFGDLDIYEIKLGDDFLMTSLFHESEDQLAHLGLKALEGDNLDIVVGGLGLGFTAVAALQDSRITSLVVVDYLEAIIDYHKKGLVPNGAILTGDPRCKLVHADFFALSKDTSKNYDPDEPEKMHDAILLDIDHSPDNFLHPTNSHIYTIEGLTELASHIKPGGIFALWADGKPVDFFTDHLKAIFETSEAHKIEFANPILKGTSVGTVYVARKKS